ncbi:MAG: amidohydrolase [Chloroflexi bacterium]|nr:amidohydrolase [Chloroflexota bacterium]
MFLAVLVVGYLIYAKPPTAPDRYILTADEIVTMDISQPNVEAILVEDGIISAVGSIDALKQQANVEVIKLDGTLTPGLIEPHTHPVATALLGATLDISNFKYDNREDIMAALKEAVDKPAITPWLIAYGWDPVAIPDLTPPTREELDAISSDRPILILTQMLHDAYVNTAAVNAAGITLDGSLLHETAAVDSVLTQIPPASEPIAELLVRRQYSRYAQAGFTTIGVAGAVGRHENPIELLRKISTEENSPLRSFVYLIERHLDAHTIGGNLDFSILGAKYWMDGSPFTGGAATAMPYAENAFVNKHLNIPSGTLADVMIPASGLIERIETLHKQGYQIALHVQGERAIDEALDAFETVQTKHPMPGLHHRLEHNALITEAQMDRAAELGVSLSFFVDHIYYYGHVLPLLFGDERTARYMPVRSAFESGAVVTLHGDHPATPLNSLQTLETAIIRAARVGDSTVGINEDITPYQALQAMTINAATQLGQQDAIGSISVGKQADFTLFSDNPLTADLETIVPLATWKSGQPVDHRAVAWLKPSLVWGAVLGLF